MASKATVQIVGLREALRRLETELPKEIVGKAGGPVLKALKRAAYPIKSAAQSYVDHDGFQPDRTKNSIKVTRMRRPQKYVNKGEGVIIAPKRGRYPLKRFNAMVEALMENGATQREAVDKVLKKDEAPWAGVQEFGAPSQGIPAQGFMRRASDTTLESAVKSYSTLIGKEIDKALRKIGRKNGVR